MIYYVYRVDKYLCNCYYAYGRLRGICYLESGIYIYIISISSGIVLSVLYYLVRVLFIKLFRWRNHHFVFIVSLTAWSKIVYTVQCTCTMYTIKVSCTMYTIL